MFLIVFIIFLRILIILTYFSISPGLCNLRRFKLTCNPLRSERGSRACQLLIRLEPFSRHRRLLRFRHRSVIRNILVKHGRTNLLQTIMRKQIMKRKNVLHQACASIHKVLYLRQFVITQAILIFVPLWIFRLTSYGQLSTGRHSGRRGR